MELNSKDIDVPSDGLLPPDGSSSSSAGVLLSGESPLSWLHPVTTSGNISRENSSRQSSSGLMPFKFRKLDKRLISSNKSRCQSILRPNIAARIIRTRRESKRQNLHFQAAAGFFRDREL
jgi:hypothetical protein